MSSIFVQIPTYHDYELPKTILHALAQQSGFHRINFGITNIFYQEPDIYIPKINNIKKVELKAPEGIGMGVSRNIANALYNGEDYYLQIDAHTRFDAGWDELLIKYVKRFKACGVEKPLLSTYPGIYKYDDSLNEVIERPFYSNFISFKEKGSEQFAEHLIPKQTAVPANGNSVQSSISGGYIFTTGDFHTVGYNDKVAFWGEEILIAAMAWTRGYDLLIPPKTLLYHLYFDSKAELQRNGRRHVWKDFADLWGPMDAQSKAEVNNILSTGRIGVQALGTHRTLDSFGKYAGLDFKNRIVI